ncbi:sce7725 family protein [Acinetobacter baumannii]|uniref:sce7725 family protein n=1 Tax=Acinetobacter baumannii TaxID=470 RepID=UPI0009289FB2|nr:sce7725 family protein [Acinetobacter baumannii]MDC4628746.1 sce7725 family protein [Acinetobacter baumannii]OJK06452.1 hypothetical protein BRY75_14235 [Acinetobacter baumannii]
MYYPILRGKLNEFLALRELSNLAMDKLFHPVIEPVRQESAPLIKTIKELNDNGLVPYIILNPTVGSLEGDSHFIINELKNHDFISFIPVVVVKESISHVKNLIDELEQYALFLTEGINDEIIEESKKSCLNFLSSNTSPTLISRINNVVLYDDCFKKQKRNADYPIESPYSSLHTFYKFYGTVVGFGDYTIVSEEYSESGGPAYVVTIHINYIDKNRYDEMFTRHYSSEDDESPANPGNKFKEALTKFIADKNSSVINFVQTSGIDELEKIYKSNHFPGLGQVKKISIKHHIETINDFLINKGKTS